MFSKYLKAINLAGFIPCCLLCMGQWSFNTSITGNYRVAKYNIYDYLGTNFTKAKDLPISGFSSTINYSFERSKMPLRIGLGLCNWGITSARTSEKSGSNIWVYEEWKFKRRYYRNYYFAQFTVGSQFKVKNIEIQTDISLNHNFMSIYGVVWREDNDLNKSRTKVIIFRNDVKPIVFPGLITRINWRKKAHNNCIIKYYSGFQLYFVNPDFEINKNKGMPYSISIAGIDLTFKNVK